MKNSVAVLLLIVAVLIFWLWTTRKEKYETTQISNCAPGYISSCVLNSIPGGNIQNLIVNSNICPENSFVMCTPDLQYQLNPVNICPSGFDIHPESHKCAPKSSIKAFKATETINAS